MSQILNTPKQLLQALEQLSAKPAPVQQQNVQVLVKHLGTQVVLALPRNHQSKTTDKNVQVSLPIQQLIGKLENNQRYSVQVVQAKNTALTSALHTTSLSQTSDRSAPDTKTQTTAAILQFFTQSKTTSPTPFALPESLQKAIFTLPPKQLFGKTVPPTLPVIQARVLATTANSVTLELPEQTKSTSSVITLDIPNASRIFRPNQSISLQLVAQGKQWRIKLNTDTPAITTSQTPNSANSKYPTHHSTTNSQTSSIETGSAMQTEHTGRKTRLEITPRQPIIPMLQQSIGRWLTQHPNHQLCVNRALITSAFTNSKINSLQKQTLQSFLQSDKTEPVIIQANRQQQPSIKMDSHSSIAQLPLSRQQFQSLKSLGLQLPPTSDSKGVSINAQVQKSSTELSANAISESRANTTVETAKSPSLGKELFSPEVIKLLKPQIEQMLRQVHPKKELPGKVLQQIEAALKDPELFRESSSKAVFEQLNQSIQQIKVNSAPQDAAIIKQLLTGPAMGISPMQMINPPPAQGFVGGLVTLLQLSLAARLQRQHPSKADQIQSSIRSLLSHSSLKAPPSAIGRTLQDVSQADQKHQIIRGLSKLLANHQASKLASFEQLLQGQESLYYLLPNGFSNGAKDIELLIKREQHKKQQQTKNQANQVWQLSMKLDVGDQGELLSNAKLIENNLELNIYASTAGLTTKVLDLLPFLHKRLQSLGIEVSKSHCQQGLIPKTLDQRPYHIFQTQA